MTVNHGYIGQTAGRLKIVTIVLATIVVALSYCSHFASGYTRNRDKYEHLFTANVVRSMWREWMLMTVSTLCLIISIINLTIHCRSLEFHLKQHTAIYDFLYHAASTLLLGISGVLFVVSGVKIFEFNCTSDNECQLFELKLAAGGISLMSGLIYGATGVVVLTNRKDVERDALIVDSK